ncbi:hypothetical protein [Halorussus lipolyticus]|uniref:hypothetical protein n=1 Tax=Halorussus lipolyticus TaxID=3034024 RepID=UPI0023E8A90C|nr:hypothetical protein [Halorussus sp. DT80]
MYSLAQIKTGLRNPWRTAVELNTFVHSRFGRCDYNPAGIDIFEQDWDNLIVLDACRYDEYERQSPDGGRVESRTSRAGATYEFLTANFTGRELHDTVYVSANPWYQKIRDQLGSSLHQYVPVRSKAGEEADSIEELTVGPEPVSEKAREANDNYPNKRLLIHYLQPHTPYLGPTGREEFEIKKGMWKQVKESDVSDETLWQAYRENLELALDSVSELIADLPGKTVVTADHGEHLGDRSGPIPVKTYGHFVGLYTEELVKVPWHVYDNGERKEIVSEAPESDSATEDVDRQLEALGYKL